MTTLTMDSSILAKLHNLGEFMEVRDESGRILGYFHPLLQPGHPQGDTSQSPFTDAELQHRRQQRVGRPLSELLKNLSPS